MWNLVMFDLPVGTKRERREAVAFRKLLLDLGWQRSQFSVYVRYVPTGMSIVPEVRKLKNDLPASGKVEIVAITDRQWAKAIRFVNSTKVEPEQAPQVLTLF